MITMALMGNIRRLGFRDRLSTNEIAQSVPQHDQELAAGESRRAGVCAWSVTIASCSDSDSSAKLARELARTHPGEQQRAWRL